MELLHYAQFGLPEDIRRCKESGRYQEAIRLIDLRLTQPGLPQALKGSLLYQKDICRHILAEFPYSKAEALALIRQRIPDFEEALLDRYLDERRVRWIFCEGAVRIFDRFFDSLCKTVPDFARRAEICLPGVESAQSGSKTEDFLDAAIGKIRETGSMSNRIRIRATVRLKDEHFTPGMFLRAHLPIPAACPQQSDIRIEKIQPEGAVLGPEDAQQRTIRWEGHWQENPTFLVEYSYTHTARFTDAYHGTGIPGKYDFDLQEQPPHLVFTPYIRTLCQELTEGMTDPLEKARAFYDFITKNMGYTYMPSYVLLENIAEECAKSFTGDCGVFAALFITLCRCAGIPAQWQSGLTVEPDFIGGHDWTRFYVEPYGWLFADPSYGVSAQRLGREDRRQFYFGNLDPYRFVANAAFQAPLSPFKKHPRADPYDNQLGEIETAEHGFAFSDYERTKEVLLCQAL